LIDITFHDQVFWIYDDEHPEEQPEESEAVGDD